MNFGPKGSTEFQDNSKGTGEEDEGTKCIHVHQPLRKWPGQMNQKLYCLAVMISAVYTESSARLVSSAVKHGGGSMVLWGVGGAVKGDGALQETAKKKQKTVEGLSRILKQHLKTST